MGDSHIERMGVGGGGVGGSSFLVGVRKAGLIPLRVFRLKRSTARAFSTHFWGSESKKDSVI